MPISNAPADSESILERVHRTNPFEGFPLDEWPPDMQGWGSKHRVIGQLIREVQPELIVEVGSWKGGSAIHMADEIKSLGLSTPIICVDTWLGSPGIYRRRDHTYDSLQLKNGYPQLYFQFMANVLHSGHQDIIVPLPQTSDNAIQILRDLRLRPQLIYIDAAHEYDPVKKDLSNYFPILADGGVMVGDDFRKSWPGVVKAVEEYTTENDLNLHIDSPKFVLARRELESLGLQSRDAG
jgi:predicted O-methyltransferase YrrM